MITFKVTTEQVQNWFPTTYQNFINELRNSKSRSNDVSEEKMEWYLVWGFFVKKAKTEEEKEIQSENYLKKMNLVYEDRVELEMPRIRCSISMKAGYYYRMDRTMENTVPDFVSDMAKEIIKYMMLEEQQYIGNQNVIDSIKEFIDSLLNSNSNQEEVNLDMDSILDKINEGGMSSLTQAELGYLEKMSRSK